MLKYLLEDCTKFLRKSRNLLLNSWMNCSNVVLFVSLSHRLDHLYCLLENLMARSGSALTIVQSTQLL